VRWALEVVVEENAVARRAIPEYANIMRKAIESREKREALQSILYVIFMKLLYFQSKRRL
jgi:hypothetical protein